MHETKSKYPLFNWSPLDERIICAAVAPLIYLTGNPGTARALIAAQFLLSDPTTGPALWVNINSTMPSLGTSIADSLRTAISAGRVHVKDIQPTDDSPNNLSVKLKQLLKSQSFSRLVLHNCDLLAAPDDHATYSALARLCRNLESPILATGTMTHLGAEIDLAPAALSTQADVVMATRLYLSSSSRSLSISIIKPVPTHQSRQDRPLYFQVTKTGLHHDSASEFAGNPATPTESYRNSPGFKRTYTFMPELLYFSSEQEQFIRHRVDSLNSTKNRIRIQLPERRYNSPLEYNRHFEEFKQGHRHWDLFVADVYRLRELVEKELIWPLDEFMPSEWRERFLPLALDQCTIDGRLVAVPHWINVGVLIYRADLLTKYKLEPPRTWDDLVSQAKTIMKGEARDNFTGMLFQGAPSESLTINFLEFLWNNGGDVFDQPLHISINSPKARESLQFMYDLIHKYRIAPDSTPEFSETETGRRFHAGQAAFLRGWPQILSLTPRRRSLNQAQIGLTSLPTHDGTSPGQSVIGGFCFVIPRYVENPEALMEFCRQFYSADAIPELSIRGWTCPPYLAAYENKDVLRHRPFYSQILDLMNHGRARKNIPYYESLSNIIQGEVNDALRGLKTPEKALEVIAEDLHNRVYKQVRELRLQRVTEYISQHLHEDLSRNNMAALCHLSPSYFSTLFAETMNCPFAKYVNEKRIQQARHLLETTELNIGEIAEAVGFKDQGYFCNVFREETRMPPSRYRLDALSKVIHR